MLGRPDSTSPSPPENGVRQQARAHRSLAAEDVADLCAEFQAAVADSVVDRVERAMALGCPGARGRPSPGGGGWGCRQSAACAQALAGAAERGGYRLHVPPPALCTDNAAMVAWAGAERLARGLTDDLAFEVRARWPLDPLAPPALGAGKQGAKA
jgi:N6-L-threonylcarbamoyladenine synthase